MSHPCARPGSRSRLSATLVLAALLTALVPWAPASGADPDPKAAPLTVQLVQLSPAAIPTKGHLVLTGTVTNDSDETWIAVNVHPFISSAPMTTRAELAAAALVDPTADVGSRLTEPGQFVAVGDLEPGQRVDFTIRLPVKDLPIGDRRPGVYWIGVHALGQATAGGRSVLGRARTFIPLVTDKSASTSVAVVVPVREQVRRDARGRLLGTSDWSDSLADTGRLGRIAGFLTSAGPTPLTLLVDPSVLDAVSDLAQGNPRLSFGRPVRRTPSESPSTSPSPSRSSVRTDAGDRESATAWLGAVTTAARRHVTLGLGYADPDVAALLRLGAPLYPLSERLATETFSGLGIDAVPTVAPPDGWLDDETLAGIKEGTTVLVSDHSKPQARTRWQTAAGQDLVLVDQQTSSGGPSPTPRLDALALRQRIVAEAALRTTEDSEGPLVVQLPSNWDPGQSWLSADFFGGLDQPWLHLMALGANTTGTPTFAGNLSYPAAQRKQEIAYPNVAAARTLSQTATALSQLLQSKNDVAHDLAGIALNSVSVHARHARASTRTQVLDTNSAIRERIGKVEVLGTDFVTLSGGSGTLAVTLVNGLSQPVLVGVEPRTSSTDVTIAASKPVKMAPGERTVLRLKAKASSIGVSRVTLTPVTKDGTELGTPLEFSLRTSQVGKTIWFVLIAGAVLLVVMVLRRIRRGLLEHRWKGRG